MKKGVICFYLCPLLAKTIIFELILGKCALILGNHIFILLENIKFNDLWKLATV